MEEEYKNYPFYDWVPKPLGIIFMIILFVPMITMSGVYSANSGEMMSGLGIQSEYIAFAGFCTSIGMAAFSPFFYELVCIRREKMMCIVGFSILFLLSFVCAQTDSLFILGLCSLLMGFVRQTLLMAHLFVLIRYGFGIEATKNITPGCEPTTEEAWDAVDSEKMVSQPVIYLFFMIIGQLGTWLTAWLAYAYEWQYVYHFMMAFMLAGIIIGQSTEYYTSHSYKPTKRIAQSAETGPATVIISGIGMGMISTAIPVLTISAAIILAYLCAIGFDFAHMLTAASLSQGLYGIGIAAVGMLSTLGITLATDAYGPIADNAGGNAEMSGLDPEVRKRTDALDALGNTTAATGKGFAIGSAALTALALLASYIEEVKIGLLHIGETSITLSNGTVKAVTDANILDFVDYYHISMMNPNVLIGVFIGSMMAFLFCGLTMNAVGRAAQSMVEEVRRQFREIKGILEGKATPDYARCVEISTKGAQREMLLPSILAIVAPVLTGFIFGVAGVMGLLVGGLGAGFVLAIFMANSGGAWDNAKKFIEEGNYGGKGSECHKATVVGDTVGDPFKDTAGPSLNILIKLMSMVSIVVAGLTVAYSLM